MCSFCRSAAPPSASTGSAPTSRKTSFGVFYQAGWFHVSGLRPTPVRGNRLKEAGRVTEVTRLTASGEESRGPTNTTVNYPSTALSSSCLYQTFSHIYYSYFRGFFFSQYSYSQSYAGILMFSFGILVLRILLRLPPVCFPYQANVKFSWRLIMFRSIHP